LDKQTLKAEVRTESGKGPARQLRMKGLIPAVFYGPGKSPKNLTVSPDALSKLLMGPYGRNQLIELELEGGNELALVRDVEVEPLSRRVLHCDFYSVALDRPVRAKVPFGTRGRAVGVQKGGRLRQIYRDLPVVGTPDKIPAAIEVDVAALDLHDAIKVKDITLPAGVAIDFPAERPVVSVETKEKEKPEEGEVVPGAPGAAAAGSIPPAAGAAAAAPAKAAAGKDAKGGGKDDKKKK
jgi:large subunit ribosomal protein L25